jgi:rhodanese-related sulfurtransferase
MQRSQPLFENVSPEQVKARLDAGEDFLLLDVREPEEYATAHIEGSELKPLSAAQEWANDLPRDKPVVVFCHHGGRSAHIASALAQQLGYTNIANMTGGIDAWAERIDPTVPRY